MRAAALGALGLVLILSLQRWLPKVPAVLVAVVVSIGAAALFDLSSTWMEGKSCPLTKFGHSRDGKRGLPQIEFGLLGDAAGRPVAVRVFDGNTSDSRSFLEAIRTVRDQFGLTNLTMVGDRGMITQARIDDLKDLPVWVPEMLRITVDLQVRRLHGPA